MYAFKSKWRTGIWSFIQLLICVEYSVLNLLGEKFNTMGCVQPDKTAIIPVLNICWRRLGLQPNSTVCPEDLFLTAEYFVKSTIITWTFQTSKAKQEDCRSGRRKGQHRELAVAGKASQQQRGWPFVYIGGDKTWNFSTLFAAPVQASH